MAVFLKATRRTGFIRFIYLICSGNLCFLHWSNHTFCLVKTPVDTSDRMVCPLSFLSASSPFIFPPCHPSLSLPIPHSGHLPSFFDNPQLMYLTQVSALSLSSVMLGVSHHLAFLKLMYCLRHLVLAERTLRIQLNFPLSCCPLSDGDIFQAPLA